MSTKSGLIFLISSIILVLICIVGIIGVYYFDWLKIAKPNYTLYTTTSDSDNRFSYKEDVNENELASKGFVIAQNDQQDAVIAQPEQKDSNENTTTQLNTEKQTENNVDNSNEKNISQNVVVIINDKSTTQEPVCSNQEKTPFVATTTNEENNKVASPEQKQQTNKSEEIVKVEPTNVKNNDAVIVKNNETINTTKETENNAKIANKTTSNPVKPKQETTFTKTPAIGKDGSPIKIGFTFDKQRDFHSYGQYISADEYKYRLALINNLKIKTIVIDAVTKGNGISQEYYKVAYNSNMIPAKILDEITTSKEFRNLIPKEYLEIESKLTTFPKNGKVCFNNTDIKEILVLWSQGKLTPTQKAWQVNAKL